MPGNCRWGCMRGSCLILWKYGVPAVQRICRGVGSASLTRAAGPWAGSAPSVGLRNDCARRPQAGYAHWMIRYPAVTEYLQCYKREVRVIISTYT